MTQRRNFNQNLYLSQPHYRRPEHEPREPQFSGSQRQHEDPDGAHIRGHNYHASHYHYGNVPDVNVERNYYDQNRDYKSFGNTGSNEYFNRFENAGLGDQHRYENWGEDKDRYGYHTYVNEFHGEVNPGGTRFVGEYPEDDYRSGSGRGRVRSFENPQGRNRNPNRYRDEDSFQGNWDRNRQGNRYDEMQNQNRNRNWNEDRNQGNRNQNMQGGYGGRNWNEYENDRDNRRHNNF